MEGTSTCNEGHEDQVDGILDGGNLDGQLSAKDATQNAGYTYNQIAGQDLHDLRPHARPTLKEPL